ncbi:class I SAM-dependent methyltransferase [Candidatus Omnitrophota bacterium]
MDYEKGGRQKDIYKIDEVVERICPLCNSSSCSKIYSERGAIGIVRCKDCGIIYTNPIVKEPEKNYWGDEKKYFEEARLIFEGKAQSHRDINYLEDLRVIERIKPDGNFLDIGTNMGMFLRNARGRKWNVVGVEPSPAVSQMARKYFGLNVKTTYLDKAGFEDEYFDIVAMTDVFEHIAESKKMLGDVRKVLKKDGILFIKVPNGKYGILKLFLARITKKTGSYDIFDSYEHLTHYSHETLKRMLEESGFRIKKSFIGRPIQIPAWHKHVGHYYQYPSPWFLDWKNHILRQVFYWISKVERMLRFGNIGYFAPNITVIAEKE